MSHLHSYHGVNTASHVLLDGRTRIPMSEYTFGFPMAFGHELEVTKDRNGYVDQSCHDLTDVLYEDMGDQFFYETDCSIGCGVEIVSRPATLKTLRYSTSLKLMLKRIKKAGFTQTECGACGLHIHVGTAQLGAMADDRRLAIAKILILAERHAAELWKLSRRPFEADSHEAHYCAPVPSVNISSRCSDSTAISRYRSYYNEANHNIRGRYRTVNVLHSGTVEFRLFNATLDRDTFIADTELVANICEYAMEHSVAECCRSTWAEVAHQHMDNYRELKAELERLGL